MAYWVTLMTLVDSTWRPDLANMYFRLGLN